MSKIILYMTQIENSSHFNYLDVIIRYPEKPSVNVCKNTGTRINGDGPSGNPKLILE